MAIENMNRKMDPISPYEMCSDPLLYQDMYQQPPIMNPSMQYEQMYLYYKYLTQQMDYKIKCKEYEKYQKV